MGFWPWYYLALVRSRVGRLTVLALVLAAIAPLAAAARSQKPVLEEWPIWPYSVSCGPFAIDPVAVLSSPAGVENGSKPTEVALRAVLENPAFDWLGFGAGWRLAGEDADSAQFIAGNPREGLESLSLAFKDGTWQLAGSGTCRLTSQVYGAYYAASWTLALDQPRLGRNTRRVQVVLSGGGCSSGIGLNDRSHFVFKQLGKRLLMSVWADPLPPGVYTCQGVVEPPLQVKLPGRLGARTLYEAGVYPPRLADETRPPF